jgi:UDP-3-O-[3-hydroxymyristoyl] glucosamine N-acyltransferase
MKFKINKKITPQDLSGTLKGDKLASIEYVSSFENADKECLAFYIGNSLEEIVSSDAKIIIVNKSLELDDYCPKDKAIITCNNPMSLFVSIICKDYDNKKEAFSKCSDFVSENNIHVGKNTYISNNVSICTNTSIGDDCRVQPSSVIGSIGMAYVENDDFTKTRFPHLGGVSIGDCVDIGANVTIVKGILKDTSIGDNTKIGNNVNIGHNVNIGKNCFISSGVTLAGSVIIEDDCWIAPSVTIVNKVLIRKKSFISIGSLVSKDTEERGFYAGSPARKIKNV